MPKRDARHMSAQRERIVRAVIECIADKGVERTSVADICRKAGLSSGALYVHFANKDEIVAEALRYGSMTETTLPDSWGELVSMIAGLESQMGFDIRTIARNRLYLHAESMSPGILHDVYRPILQKTLSVFAEKLQQLADRGEITLRMSAAQTAASISAFIDGMLWIALATDRPLEELKPELAAGLTCFVTIPAR
jgi:AcrR family transcriptional regulator